MRRALLTALLCAIVVARPASAQEQRGSVEGVVKDTSGGVLPGATVEARGTALAGVQTTTTDASGAYRFPALPPGKYDITVTLSGFGPARATGVALELGQILRVNLTMSVGGVTETVQVKAEAPLIDVKQNAAATSIGQEVIERIPKGRDFTSLVSFSAPGANDETRNGGIQVDGASGSENRFLIDGMDTTSLRSGTSNKGLATDFIAEVQVKSSGYNAEYRASTGGVVSAITKSGSNTLHGSAGTYFTNDQLRGKQRLQLRLNPLNQNIAEQFNTPDDNFSTWEPVFDLGGPVIRDRIWFYAGYLPQRQHTDRTVTFLSNNVTQTFVQDTRDMNVNYNITGQILPSLRARFTAINGRTRGAPGFPAIEPDGTSRSTFANFQGDRAYTNSFNDSYSAAFDWVKSNRLYANLTTGYLTYGSRDKGPVASNLRHSFSASNFQFTDIPASLKQANGYVDDISSSKTVKDDFGRLTINGDVTYYASWKGRHTIKGGIQFEQLTNNVNRGAQYPTMQLFWDASRSTLDGRRVRGTYGYYTVTRGVVTLGDIKFSNTGIFLQDGWTLNDRLTLNLGVRTEREDVPSYRPENPGIHFGMKEKIAPRVGFAWDVAGNGQWKTYGSWGVFYDLMKLSMSRILFGADRWVDYYYTLDTYDWPSIQCGYPPVGGPTCPGTFIEQADFRHVTNDATDSLIDPGLKPMKAQELTLGMDHELNKTTSVGVRYAHKWLNRAVEAYGVIEPGVGEIYRIANPGFGWDVYPLRNAGCPDCPIQPPAKRVYDGVELRLRKRFSQRWEMTSSYTLSRLYGNYSGLANSDENGRTDPNSSRGFDSLAESYDASGRAVFGPLQSDRPHVFKLQGSYDFKWGTSVGVNYILQSGTPLQTQMNHISSIFFFPNGRGDLGRTPAYSQTDLLLQHSLRAFGSRVNVSVNIQNLFDQDIVRGVTTTPYRDNINVPYTDFFKGFDPVAWATANGVRPDARFKLPSSYQARRVIQLQAKVGF